MRDPFTSYFLSNAGYQGPIALMYHSIERCVGVAKWPWSISLGQFKDHLDLLSGTGWTTRTMAELVQSPAGSLTPKTVVITFDDGFENNLDAVEVLVERKMRATWFIVTGAIGNVPHWEDRGRPVSKILGANSLRAMKAAGMEIGSHSVNHCNLPTLADSRLTLELTQSKCMLEEVLDGPVESFAYPFGAWDQRCEIAVAKAGYRYACTTRTGAALKEHHPLRIRRLSVFNHDSAATLARKLSLISNDGRWATMLSYYSRRAAVRLRQNVAK